MYQRTTGKISFPYGLNDSSSSKIYFYLYCFVELLDYSINQNMEKVISQDGRTLWQCNICKKIHHLKHVISDHVEHHLGDVEFECPYCHKKKKSRSNLRSHISSYHREEHQMYKIGV